MTALGVALAIIFGLFFLIDREVLYTMRDRMHDALIFLFFILGIFVVGGVAGWLVVGWQHLIEFVIIPVADWVASSPPPK